MTIKEIINKLKKVEEKVGSNAKVFYYDVYSDEYEEIGYVGDNSDFEDIDFIKKCAIIM